MELPRGFTRGLVQPSIQGDLVEEETSKGNGKKWFFGCCGGLAVLALLCAGAGWFGAGWAKDKMASTLREGIAEALEESQLSDEQSAGINTQAERLEQAIQGWGLVEALEHMGNLEQVSGELQEIGQHIILVSYGGFVLPNTPMPEEERRAGLRILERYSRGIDEGSLSLDNQDDDWHLNSKKSGDDSVEFDVVEVRAHLADLEQRVEAAGIADEPYEVDLADKLEKIVDAMIGETH